MRFLVIGCGSIGKRHINNLKALGHTVTGCEKDPSRARRTEKEHNIEVLMDLDEALLRGCDGAFICTPTSSHLTMAFKVVKKGINLFIEKPVSDRLDELDKLSKTVRDKGLVALVGCNLRFSSGFRLVRKLIESGKIGEVRSAKAECGFYLPYWHPDEDYRGAYSAKKRLGGGVIFDDIHEIDAMYALFGRVKEVFCFAGKLSDLDIDTEDVAEIFLNFASGVIAQVHLDYLQRTYRRYYEIIGEKGVIVWNVLTQTVELYSEKTNQRRVFQEGIYANHDLMFMAQIKHFVKCIKDGARSANGISSAKEVLEIAMACHESAKKKEMIRI